MLDFQIWSTLIKILTVLITTLEDISLTETFNHLVYSCRMSEKNLESIKTHRKVLFFKSSSSISCYNLDQYRLPFWDIVFTRFSYFDTCWPQMTFDRHKKQQGSCSQCGKSTYHIWQLFKRTFLRYCIYMVCITSIHIHTWQQEYICCDFHKKKLKKTMKKTER